MEQKNIYIIIGLIIAAIGVWYYFSGYNYNQQNIPTASSPAMTSPQGPNTISIKNFSFNPDVLTVKAGDTVTWTNNDSVSHDISGNGFKSEVLRNGQSYSFTFNTSGTYDYNCGIHPSMKGTIVVK